jgi:hypothetical protein
MNYSYDKRQLCFDDHFIIGTYTTSGPKTICLDRNPPMMPTFFRNRRHALAPCAAQKLCNSTLTITKSRKLRMLQRGRSSQQASKGFLRLRSTTPF